MTIADVVDFYERSAVLEAKGGEEPCTGCDKVLEKDEAFSYYEIAGRPRTPRALPPNINLCQKCTFLVMGSNLRPFPTPEE